MLATNVSRPNKLKSFEVIESPPRSQIIAWRADARWVQRPESAPTDDAGAQFAAIVAQRSGLEPTTQWA
jgi:hypothetical protein